jgi:hypothetical protein
MTTREALEQLLRDLPEDRLGEVLDFAQFLRSRDDQLAWREFGRTQFARAYGPDEPEYTEADLNARSRQ